MVEILLLDLDDTILDFGWAEEQAITRTMTDFGIDPTPETRSLYSRINKDYWRRLERKELTHEQVRVGRFAEFFRTIGADADANACADTYVGYLAQGHHFLPGAEDAVKRLSGKYRLFLVTNGNAPVQKGRLKSADLPRYFENIFISQEIGANKPAVEFFDRCFVQIPDFAKEKAMIVGDNLMSDILGGSNAGIATCWVNPKHLPRQEGIRVDYEIERIAQLETILDTLR